jgi:hypothetical protein
MDNAEARFLDALYFGIADNTEFKRALALIQDMFDCAAGALVLVDTRSPGSGIALTSGIFDQYGRLYVEQFAAIDPAPAMFANLPTGAAAATDRLVPAEIRKTHPFVHEFFRPIGLVETLGGKLLFDQARFSLIGLQRGKDRKAFDDDDIAKLQRLMPHITRALQLRRTFLNLEAKDIGLQAALDRLPAGLVLLRSDRTAIFINAAMHRLAKRADGLTLNGSGCPLPVNAVARRKFNGMFSDVLTGGAGGVVTVPRAGGGRDYALLIAPLPLGHDTGMDSRQEGGVTVLVHDPDSQALTASELLEQALQLPKAAARLVVALAGDDDLKSFAEREGVTIHTARFHLRTALARTGAKTQAELVRLAVRLMRDFAGAGPN